MLHQARLRTVLNQLRDLDLEAVGVPELLEVIASGRVRSDPSSARYDPKRDRVRLVGLTPVLDAALRSAVARGAAQVGVEDLVRALEGLGNVVVGAERWCHDVDPDFAWVDQELVESEGLGGLEEGDVQAWVLSEGLLSGRQRRPSDVAALMMTTRRDVVERLARARRHRAALAWRRSRAASSSNEDDAAVN